MKQAAKLQCSTTIRCDMYRHVARCHLDLAQLWRCPVPWCTAWKGAPQDLMDHVRYAHRVPEEVQSIKLETLIPPWTVTRKVYMESLTSRHSGISNDILLFSDIGLSLAHHSRVHKKGAFRKNYMSQLCTLLPLPAAPLAERGSPQPGCSAMEDSPEAVGTSPRPSRHTFARRRISRVRETPRRVAPHLTELDPLAAVGAMVFDCCPQVLPGAMDVSDTELPEIRSMTRASAATASPPEREQSFGGGGGGGDLLGSICPELGVAPLVDPGTDCEDELPAPADLPAVGNQEMDSELQSVFIDVVLLPIMITPVSDVDRALCAPENQVPVIAPPAVSPVMIRPPTATTSAEPNLLSPIQPLASATSVGISSKSRTPPDITDRPREGPFDIHHDRQRSATSPQLLQETRGCLFRMTSYDVESDGPNFSPEHGVQLNDPWFLEYVGTPESARLMSRSPEYWVHHMGRENALSAALQLQHDAGLILSNVQVLQQLVTSLCRTSSDVLLAVHGRQPFPSSAVQQVMPSYRVRRAAHYRMAMGLWRPPVDTGIQTPMSSVACNACTYCQDCFPRVPR